MLLWKDKAMKDNFPKVFRGDGSCRAALINGGQSVPHPVILAVVHLVMKRYRNPQ